MSARYAVYAMPGALAPHPLRALADAWLGRSADGSPVTPAVPRGWTRAEIDAITVSARRYGFHATLKAPFRLAPGLAADALAERVAALARVSAPVVMPKAEIRVLGGFLALMPGAAAPWLHALGDSVVRELDDLRISDGERRERYAEAPLTARQRQLLEAWDYPYVLEEFRPHFTLTDRIPEPLQARAVETLTEYLAGHLGRDLAIDALCVFEQPAPAMDFHLRSVHPLSAATAQHSMRSAVLSDRFDEEPAA